MKTSLSRRGQQRRNLQCLRAPTAAFAAATCFTVLFATAHAQDGTLDATFGTAGKVILGSAPNYISPVANDVAVQPDGKIVVAGYETTSTGGSENWRISRLNTDGSADTTFAPDHSGTVHYFAGSVGTRAQTVALRPDGRIVVGGNFVVGPAAAEAFVMQLTSSGALDTSFGNPDGYIGVEPQTDDSTYLSRLVIEPNGSVDIAGTYYRNQGGFNSNEFLFDRIASDGTSDEQFQYEFGTGANQDDHALDLTIDNQGRYVLAGYHRGASGNYDFAAIRIRSDLFDVDNTFGNAGQTTVDFGDNGDYCYALALTTTGYIALGGQANGQAALSLLDPDGVIFQWYSGGIGHPTKFPFVFGTGGGNDTITKLIFDDYNTKYPQLLAIGSGSQGGVPYGLMFGIARVNFPGYSNFTFDTSFNGSGTEGIWFNERPDGIGLLTTSNHGRSAVFAGGKLVVVGDTIAPGNNTDIAITRLAAFDGIFLNGFDTPSL